MSLVPYTRYEPIFGSFFNDVFSDTWKTPRSSKVEGIDLELREDSHSVLVRAELPGVKDKDVNVTVEDGILTISGSKQSDWEKKDDSHQYSERWYGSFSRSLRLPEGTDADKVKASLKEGILELKFEKLEERKPKSIQIKSE